MVSAHKTYWDRKLPSAVHAYNTSEKKTTGNSPYFLVFGQTALHGIEMEVETLRVMAARSGDRIQDCKLPDDSNPELRGRKGRGHGAELGKFRPRGRKTLMSSYLGITESRKEEWCYFMTTAHEDFPGKLHTRWMGPYRVTEIVYQNGSLQLEDLQGNWLDTRVNGSRVKQYQTESSSEG